MNEVSIPSDVAREIAKLIRNVDNGKMEDWAEMLDPINFSDKVFRIVNFYIKSGGDPSMATNEIINECMYVANSVKMIENIFIIKKDLINLLENGANF